MAELAEREGVSASALEFIILTALRSGEGRGARWEEVDWEQRTWTVPGERMKRGKAHHVPLSPEAIQILEQQRGLVSDWVFPSGTRGRDGIVHPQSAMVFNSH